MRDLRYIIPALLLACGLILGAGWGDPEPEQASASEDGGSGERPPLSKPEWEKWAFFLPTHDGSNTVSFNNLARSGKPFVIVWWQSDCPVCHLQLPYVQQLSKMVERGEADMQIVSVNIDTSDADCASYIKDKGISFSVLRDPRARRTDQTYKVRDNGTPVTYVFKSGGVPAGHFAGFKKGFPEHVLDLVGQQPAAEPAPRGTTAGTPGRRSTAEVDAARR